MVLVIPLDSLDKFVPSRNLSSLSRVKEMDLICAAFSGHLDPSTIVAAPGKNFILLFFWIFRIISLLIGY